MLKSFVGVITTIEKGENRPPLKVQLFDITISSKDLEKDTEEEFQLQAMKKLTDYINEQKIPDIITVSIHKKENIINL